MQTLHRFSTNFFKVWKVFLCSRHRDYLGLDFKTANVDQRVCVTNKGHLFWRAFTMQIGIKRHYQVASWEMYDPILLDWKFTTFLAFVCMALLIGQFQRWQEGGVTCSKGSQAWTQTWGLCSEGKASVHGTPALPTELMCAPKIYTSDFDGKRKYIEVETKF